MSSSEDLAGKLRRIARLFDQEELVEVRDEFMAATKELKIGEIALYNNFHLARAMSSIELMDPKMDNGMHMAEPNLSLESAIETGRIDVVNMSLEEQIATFDATVASIVSCFKYCSSPDCTVYTNICLLKPELVKNESLRILTIAARALFRTVRYIIEIGGVSSEEDFNAYCVSDIRTIMNDEVIAEISAYRKKLRGAKITTDPRWAAINYRLTFVRHFLEVVRQLIPNDRVVDVDSTLSFSPNMKQGAEALNMTLTALLNLQTTIDVGLAAPEEGDGNYSWLSAFEPDVNHYILGAGFPRCPRFETRAETYQFFIERLDAFRLCLDRLASVGRDMIALISAVRDISFFGADVFIRSMVQLIVFPIPDFVFGLHRMDNLVKDSISMLLSPYITDTGYAISKDTDMQGVYQSFSTHFGNVLQMIMMCYGYNLAKQVDKIAEQIVEFAKIYEEAEAVDSTFNNLLMRQLDSKEIKKPYGITTFVAIHCLDVMKYYLALGFQLNLYEVYELPYVYFYLGEVICLWQYRLFSQCKSYLQYDHDVVPPGVDNKGMERRKKQLAGHKTTIQKIDKELVSVQCDASTYECLFRLLCGQIQTGHIKPPEGEAYRYQLRFLPFVQAPTFVRVPYEKFKDQMDEIMKAPPKCSYEFAVNSLNSAWMSLGVVMAQMTGDSVLRAKIEMLKTYRIVCNILHSRPEKMITFDLEHAGETCMPTLRVRNS